MAALLGGVSRNAPLAAAGLVAAAYVGLQPLLLAVRGGSFCHRLLFASRDALLMWGCSRCCSR